jgi:Ca2+-binding RTX toxin-like protein
MARIISATTVTAGIAASLVDSEDLYVVPGVALVSSGNTCVSANFDFHDIMIAGAVFGGVNGIMLGATKLDDLNSSIWIGGNGAVTAAQVGIGTVGTGISVTNEGSIHGGTYGLRHLGNALDVINFGSVDSPAEAMFIVGTGNRVENHGSISSQGIAIHAMVDTTLPVAASASITVENFGTISGTTAFLAPAMAGTNVFTTTLFNHGVIRGMVNFADGNDLYDGHDGTATRVLGNFGNDTMLGGEARDIFLGEGGADLLEGGGGRDLLVGGTEADTLEGGDGDDVLAPGAGADLIDGGAGTRDMLDYAGSGVVAVSLLTGEATGTDAAGDIFTGIEWLGGGIGNDQLRGDGGGNALFGRQGNDALFGEGGADVLSGDAGNDTLQGGLGVDVLRGGLGADVFRFVAPNESGAPGQVRDRIADFVRAEGDRIDLSFIDADLTTPDNQPFSFIGATNFTEAGQLRAVTAGGNVVVSANLDGVPGTAEFSIVLTGTVAPIAADFIL